jgi:hypothetical protein
LLTFGYYSHICGLEHWQRYAYPVFGISEVYIQRFIEELYEYYGRLAHESGLFNGFILNAPVSLDIVRMAYVEGDGFKEFLRGL